MRLVRCEYNGSKTERKQIVSDRVSERECVSPAIKLIMTILNCETCKASLGEYTNTNVVQLASLHFCINNINVSTIL